MPYLIGILIGGFAGALGMYVFLSVTNKKLGVSLLDSAKKEAAMLRESAQEKAQLIKKEARDVFTQAQEKAALLKKEVADASDTLKERKELILANEKQILEKEARIDKKYDELEEKKLLLMEKENANEKERALLEEKNATILTKLEEIAKWTLEEARDEVIKKTEEVYERDILERLEKKKREFATREKDLAREMLISAMQQYVGDVTGEVLQTIVPLENDDLKGKIIGREGRNIIAFEKATGVSLIIDDSPDTVFLSSYDLFRRYIAKKSLEELIADKRIQPARIEEIVEKNQQDAEQLLYELGQKTVDEMNIIDFPNEILSLIGKFRFRTSYGQNLLLHSKEVAYISEALARMLGADEQIALKGGLLHDIGKAMDHDIEGTHPEIGGRIGRKYGLDERIINIIEGHHDDVPITCIETKIIQIADAISAVRPGARRMNIEDYIKRIKEMETIATSFEGVSKAYALSAGREVRVFVDSTTVSDLEAETRARDIAAQIEANCSYPGEVKVNLIREKRVIEYAK